MAFMMVFYQTTYTLMYCMLIWPSADEDDAEHSFIQPREASPEALCMSRSMCPCVQGHDAGVF